MSIVAMLPLRIFVSETQKAFKILKNENLGEKQLNTQSRKLLILQVFLLSLLMLTDPPRRRGDPGSQCSAGPECGVQEEGPSP